MSDSERRYGCKLKASRRGSGLGREAGPRHHRSSARCGPPTPSPSHHSHPHHLSLPILSSSPIAMPPPTIAILAAGSMGSAVAARLTSHGLTVLTSLAGRSPSTHKRATDAGMQDVPFSSIPRHADFFLSILPPSEAESIAKAYLEAYHHSAGDDGETDSETERYYVDCNAVSPQTCRKLSNA